MKQFAKNIFLISLLILSHLDSFGKAFLVPVDSILNNITEISTIKVLEYEGDTTMTYVNLETKDTVTIDCKWKPYSDASIDVLKQQNPNYASWEGSFPQVGETIVLLKYSYISDGFLFARKQYRAYRFWDPRSIPFSNTVFLLNLKSLYFPTQA